MKQRTVEALTAVLAGAMAFVMFYLLFIEAGVPY